LSAIANDVRSAWEKSDNGQSFSNALVSAGLTVKAGKKDGVFVIMNGDQEIGALDRLLKEKRAFVRQKMGEFKDDNTAKETDTIRHIQRGKSEPARHSTPVSAVGIVGTSRAARKRPNRANPAITGSRVVGATSFNADDGRPGEKDRRYEQKKSLIELDRVRLSSESVLAGQSLLNHKVRKNINKFEINQASRQLESHKNGWQWVQELRNDLIGKLREIQQRYFSRHSIPEPPVSQKQEDEPEYTGMRFG